MAFIEVPFFLAWLLAFLALVIPSFEVAFPLGLAFPLVVSIVASLVVVLPLPLEVLQLLGVLVLP